MAEQRPDNIGHHEQPHHPPAVKPISNTAFYCCGIRMRDAETPHPICGDRFAKLLMAHTIATGTLAYYFLLNAATEAPPLHAAH